MTTIWKYPLEILDKQAINLPSSASILTAQVQDGQLCLWALVDPDRPTRPRTIRIAGTGHAIEGDWRHIGTVLMMGGQLVWHVFEEVTAS